MSDRKDDKALEEQMRDLLSSSDDRRHGIYEMPDGSRWHSGTGEVDALKSLSTPAEKPEAVETASRNRTRRWNIDEQDDGSLMICRDDHEKGDRCEYVRYVRAPEAVETGEPVAWREAVEIAKGIIAKMVDEFGCTIELYHRNGPTWTHKDGTEVFPVSVILDRAELIDAGRVFLASLPATHPDDIAVDAFAQRMKDKLAKKRSEGRGGWDDPAKCSAEFLSALLHEHVKKGDPIDVANLAMMLGQRGERIVATTPPAQDDARRQALEQIVQEFVAFAASGNHFAYPLGSLQKLRALALPQTAGDAT